jgi:hypothetical protein
MPPPVAPCEVHAWVKEFLRQRPDIGLGSAISDMMFEQRNPFDSKARRKPRAGFVIGTILFAVSLGCFCYFNFAR